MSNLAKGIISNGFASIVQKIVRILDQLLLVPFFLTSWGANYYGEWLTLSIIPSVLAFADLGFGSAVSNSFVLAYAAGDKQRAANLNKSGYLTISLSVFLGILLTILVLLIGDQFHLFAQSSIPAHEAMLAVTLIMASKLVSFYTQLIEGYFRGARKAAWGSLLGSGYHVINILVGLAVLLAGYGIIGYAFSQLVVSILYNIVYFYIGKQQIDLYGFRGRIHKEDLKQILQKGIGYLMSPVWQSIYFQGGTFVVRATLGAESVAVFNTVRTVCRSVNQMYSIVNSSIFPDLQYEYGRGNLLTVHRLFRIAVWVSLLMGIIGSLFLMFLGMQLYAWWTWDVLPVPSIVWQIFIIGVLFNAVWWTASVVYRMTNKPYHLAVVGVLSACFSIAVSYVLSFNFGLTGVVLGAILFDFIMMIYILPDSCHILQMKLPDLYAHVRSDYLFIKSKLVRK